MIKINNVDIATPTNYQVGIMDINKAERNANGTMIIERITTKRKIELSWNYLTQSQLSSLFNLVSPVFFTVSYPDPLTGATRSGTFYAGDRNAGMIEYKNGSPKWKDVKFNLIER